MKINSTITEYEECKMLAQYLRLKKYTFTHIPNETRTPSMGQRMKNKMMGVSPGVPDYMIIIGSRLVFIEMKRKKGGKTSDTQQVRLQQLQEAGCITQVCYGFQEAFEFIENISK